MRDTKQELLHFWFGETKPAQWFQVNPDFDSLVRERFLATYRMAADGLCNAWAVDADGTLALCILLDQIPRNMFRGYKDAFATDPQARRLAVQAIVRGYDQILPPVRRRFIYLPLEHSEDMDDQEKSVALFAAMKDDDPTGYEYALHHRDIIARFGRFPHRNAALARDSTAEEIAYLSGANAGF